MQISTLTKKRRKPRGQLAGFFDDALGDLGGVFGNIGSTVGDWFNFGSSSQVPGFGSIAGPTITTTTGAPVSDFRYFLDSVSKYLVSRDLVKLNQNLANHGIAPISQSTADYYAQRAPGGIPTWLPWVGVAGLAFLLVNNQKRR